MKRLFLLEDDLSLINGLSFAVKKQEYEIVIARTTLEADTEKYAPEYDRRTGHAHIRKGSHQRQGYDSFE